MMRRGAGTMMTAALMMLGAAAGVQAQDLPVPGVPAAREVPGAVEGVDPAMTYKVVFDLATAGPKPTEVHPMLQAVGRYVNTLARAGVPAERRKIAVVFHQGGTDYILQNDAYRAKHGGQDNPNIALMQTLKKAGVDFRVCGQAVLALKIDPKTIQPEVQLDLWALTTITNFLMKGYALIGG